MTNLAQQMRKESEKALQRKRDAERKRMQRQYKKARDVAVPYAEKTIKTLPRLIRQKAEQGIKYHTVTAEYVLMKKDGEGINVSSFKEAYLNIIDTWAKENGFWTQFQRRRDWMDQVISLEIHW